MEGGIVMFISQNYVSCRSNAGIYIYNEYGHLVKLIKCSHVHVRGIDDHSNLLLIDSQSSQSNQVLLQFNYI